MNRFVQTIACLLVFAVFGLFDYSQAHAASGNIKASIEVGYSGKIKQNKGFPVKITLDNKGGDFKGDLLIQYSPGYAAGGYKVAHVELPKGSTKTLLLSSPGISEEYFYQQYPPPIIRLYKGDWKNNDEVELVGLNALKPKIIAVEVPTVGVLSSNTDRLKALKLAKVKEIPAEVIQLTKDMIPDDQEGLGMIDYLVVDDFPISSLDDKQQAALSEWLQGGGVLIAGASAKGSQSWGQLEAELPFPYEKDASANDLSFLKTKKYGIPEISGLPIMTGAPKSDAIVLTSSEAGPLLASRAAGKGEVWQTAFSLGDEPLSSWNGYSKWLGTLLEGTKLSKAGFSYESDFDRMYGSLGSYNELFPSSFFSITKVILVFAAYLIILIPVLYFILRKLDKREHSWWLIPVISIIMSAGIFAFGAKDRLGKPELSQMGTLEVNNNGYVSGGYSGSILSNTGGSYTLSVPHKEVEAVPANSRTDIPGSGSSMAVTEKTLKTIDTHFSNVEFWSTRSVLGKVNKGQIGQFSINLSYKKDSINGEIKNGLPYDFEKVYLWSGFTVQELGPLKKGGVLKVNENMKIKFLTGPIGNGGSGNIGTSPSSLEKVKLEGLKEMVTSESDQMGTRMEKPIIFGITKDRVVDGSVKNKKTTVNNMFLIYQEFDIKGDISGPFTVKDENMVIRIVSKEGEEVPPPDMHGNVFFGDGQYIATFAMPKQVNAAKSRIASIRVGSMNTQSCTYAIYNWKTKAYEPLEEKGSVTLDKQAEKYISKEGHINIMLDKSDSGYEDNPSFLKLTVKGEAGQ